MKVSMVMIARDNRETIADVLRDAVEAGCAELCVVDTGSKDETPAIALKHGAKVIHREWVDDFAQSKNQALEMAAHDWCLVLDSDDRINNPAELRRFFENDLERLPVSCSAMKMDVHVGVGPQAHTVTQVRLIRKSSGLHFRYPIHETVICDGHDVFYLREVRIEHHREFNPEHNERNLRILLKHYQGVTFEYEPHDVQQHIRLNLGREYLGTNRKSDAVRIFDEFFVKANHVQSNDYWARLYHALATEHSAQQMGRFQRAAQCNPYRAEAWVEMARLLMSKRKWRQALVPLGRAMACTYPDDGIAYTPDYSWRPLLLVAACADMLGEYEKAHTFARAALAKGAPRELLREAVA